MNKSRIYDIYNIFDNNKKVFEGDISGVSNFLMCTKANVYDSIWEARPICGYRVVPRKGKYDTLYLVNLNGDVIVSGSKDKLSSLLLISPPSVRRIARSKKVYKKEYFIKTEEDYNASL